MTDIHNDICKYVKSIRSTSKRSYAERYYKQTICNGISVSTGELSFMGAQAVRLRIAAILKGSA